LIGAESLYGKETGGDLWEGKHTLILLHALRRASADERARALAIIRKRRPPAGRRRAEGDRLRGLVARLRARGHVTPAGQRALEGALRGPATGAKTEADVRFLRALIDRHGSIPYARRVARRWAERARRRLAGIERWMPPSVHRDFIRGLVDFVVTRER